MHPEASSIWVGLFLGTCGVTQLICPIAGKLSDRHSSVWGKRRPFIAGASVVAVLFFVLMWASSTYKWTFTYLVSLFIVEFNLNIVYSAHCGLPADLQGGGDNNMMSGTVSGVLALHSFMGALFSMFFIVATSSQPVQVQYPMYIFMLLVAAVMVCTSVKETPTYPNTDDRRITLSEIRDCYLVDLHDDMDFLWVCVGRFFFYCSQSISVFLYFYIRDMLHVEDESTRRQWLGVLVIVAQIVGAVLALPYAKLSNWAGRKFVINFACVILCGCFATFAVAPKVGAHGSWPLVLVAGIIYGMGSSAYLSVDYA